MSANLVFVGFHGSADRSTPESQNEILAAMLREAGYQVRAGSAEQRQIPRLVDQLRLVVRNLRWADVVVVDQFSGRRAWTPFIVTRITRRAAVPTVIMLHGGSLPSEAAKHPHRIDSTLRLATRVLAPSNYLAQAFRARGHEVSISPNLLNAPIVASEHPPIDVDSPSILWMRAFHPTYQPRLAVSAFAALLERCPAATMTMAGPDRGLMGDTRSYAVELGVADSVRFPGYLEEQQKADAFLHHDLFLNTTKTDNTPVSVIEAMGAGLPVVATDVGGLRDLAENGRDAVLVPDDDPTALADAMTEVIGHREVADALRIGGREVAERHGIEHVRRAWTAVLRGVGAPAGPNPEHGCAPLRVSDVEAVTAVHLQAFPASGLTGLGELVVRRYYKWQFAGPHPHPVALGAWCDGELVGFVIGGERRDAVSGFVRTSPGTLFAGALMHPSFVRRIAVSKVMAVARVIRSNRRRPRRPVDAGTDAQKRVGESGAPSFGILSIAVAPHHQGSGAASNLLDAAELDARTFGYTAMNLTVDVANVRAIRFYEKHGWRRDSEEGWQGRMVKVLDDPDAR